MMGETLTLEGTYELIACSHEGCGIQFGMPSRMYEVCKNTAREWYCPNGHRRYFTGKSDLEKSQERNQTLSRSVEQLEHRVEIVRGQRDFHERSARSFKGHLKRTKSRCHAGLCIDCNRTFQNLARHMKTKHEK